MNFSTKQRLKKIYKSFHRKVDVFYSANVMCHIEDIKSVFKNIFNSLSDNGIFVFEDPYMGDVIKKIHMIKYMMSMFIYFQLHQL